MIEKTIEVEAPVTKVYNQWTQFEEFPQFMEGVQEVKRIDDKHLHWVAKVGGQQKEWDAEILEHVPDHKIAWRSTSGAPNSGVVHFHPKGRDRTMVTLQLNYEPQGPAERIGSALGLFSRQVENDLERFRDFIQHHATETGTLCDEIRETVNGPAGGEYDTSGKSGV